MRIRLLGVMVAVVAVGAAPLVPLVSASEVVQPQVEARVDYKNGNELASEGRYVYASQGGADGGFRVVSARSGRVLGSAACPIAGSNPHNDIAVLRRGLVILATDRQKCGPNVAIFDVSKPSAPRLVGAVAAPSVHTVAVHPDGRHIYVNDGGATISDAPAGSIIDATNARSPGVVASYPLTPTGCHDMSFLRQQGRVLAFCAGGAAGQVFVWDATKPAAPVEIGRLAVPGAQVVHWARPSPDGKLLLISDEAIVAHACNGSSVPGSITIADLATPERPVIVGRISPPRGPAPVGSAVDPNRPYGCTSHQFDLIPGTRKGIFSWYYGGISIVDYSNPAAPEELAFHNPPGGSAYDAIWSNGRVWVNDVQRGLTKLRIAGL